MKKTKTQKGITLIALIITIVVLLILAVVAIGAVRDSNIIAHAQNAAVGYNQSKTTEENLLNNYIGLIDSYVKDDTLEEEKIRKAIHEWAFNGDDTKCKELGVVVFSQNTNYSYILADAGNAIYAYCLDMSSLTTVKIDENNPYYEETEELKQDIIALKEVFIGKNIENFNPQKSGDYWILSGITGLGETTEITIKQISENDKEIRFNYKEYPMRFILKMETITITDSTLTGKMIGLSQELN